MGTRIEAVSALTSHGPHKPTARRLADAAARACLAEAGKEPSEIDMLINTGVYREDNMGEPALAALIQEDIGANLGQPPAAGHGTFSFDLMNGTCGVVSAIQLESGLLRSGVIRLGAIVASDVDPDLKGFPVLLLPARRRRDASGLGRQRRRVHRLRRRDIPRVRGSVRQRAGLAGAARASRALAGNRPEPVGHGPENPVIRPAWPTAPRRRPAGSCGGWGWESARSTCSSRPLLSGFP